MSRPLHVLQIGVYPPPYGGVSTHIIRLKRFLEDHGITCSIIDWSGDSSPSKAAVGDLYVLKGPMTIRWLKLVWLVFRLKPEIVHTHLSSGTKFIGIGPSLRTLSNAKSLVTIHSSALAKSDLFIRRLITKALACTNHIIVVNDTVRSALENLDHPLPSISVIPAYIEPHQQELSVQNAEISEKVSSLKEDFAQLILVSGFITPNYRFDLAVDAIIELGREDIGLIIVGYSEVQESYLREIQTQIDPVKNQIIWLENLPTADFLYLLSQADIYLRPGNLDGDSISVREAIGMGTPVLASNGVPRPTSVRLFQYNSLSSLTMELDLLLREARSENRVHQPKEPTFVEQILNIYRLLVNT